MTGQPPATMQPAALTSLPDAQLVPALITGDAAAWRTIDFFTSNIRNPDTRRACARACLTAFARCGERGLSLETILPYKVVTDVQTRGLAGLHR